MAKWIAAILLSAWVVLAFAGEATPVASDPVIEARMMQIASELRCLVCQNQTIADSHAGLAVDLRQQVREMLQKGQDEQQIIGYMTARYGDFILYRPPFKSSTVLLWIGPGIMVIAGMATLILILRRRSRLSRDQFDPETSDPEQDQHLT